MGIGIFYKFMGGMPTRQKPFNKQCIPTSPEGAKGLIHLLSAYGWGSQTYRCRAG